MCLYSEVIKEDNKHMVFGFQLCRHLKNIEIKTEQTKSVRIPAGPRVKQTQDYKRLKCQANRRRG